MAGKPKLARVGVVTLFGVSAAALVVGIHRPAPRAYDRLFDLLAVLASVVIPLGMLVTTYNAGLLQRSMFLIAYLWFATEALRSQPHES